MTEEVKRRIEEDIKSNKIVLYMKGNPSYPQCGFSHKVCQILSGYEVSVYTFDVLKDGGVREGIKEFSNWPTIPQLYVDGKFIGGCDIISELEENGELKGILEG